MWGRVGKFVKLVSLMNLEKLRINSNNSQLFGKLVHKLNATPEMYTWRTNEVSH